MSTLDQLTVITNKGREYAYLGMYEEAINNFDNAIKSLHDNINQNRNNLNLKAEFESLLKQINKEQDLCKLLDQCIKTGSTQKANAILQTEKRPSHESKPVGGNRMSYENNNNFNQNNDFQNNRNMRQQPVQQQPVQQQPMQQQTYVEEQKEFPFHQPPFAHHNMPNVDISANYNNPSHQQQNNPSHQQQNNPSYQQQNNPSYQIQNYPPPPRQNNAPREKPTRQELAQRYQAPSGIGQGMAQNYGYQQNSGYNAPDQGFGGNDNRAPPQKSQTQGGGNFKQGRDPDEWSPPPQKVTRKPVVQGGGGGSRKVQHNVVDQKVEKGRKDYDKPWLAGLKPKTPKGPKNEDGSYRKDAFLNFIYPDGKGPDDELIKMLEKEVIDRNPNISFDDIAELDRVKEILFETVIFPLTIPKFYQGIRKPRKGVLLFGPPGTGKTMLAKA